MSDDLLTVAEVAAELRVSRMTVYRWVESGKLKAMRLPSRAVRIKRTDLDAMLADGAR